LIGPALARALADRHPPGGGAPVDAGRLDVGAAPAPRALATQIAQRIARTTTQGE
jgi:hypothetical protein